MDGTPVASVETVSADKPLTVNRSPVDAHREQYLVLADHVEDVGVAVVQELAALAAWLRVDQLRDLVGSEGMLAYFFLAAQVLRDDVTIVHIRQQVDRVDTFDATTRDGFVVSRQNPRSKLRQDVQVIASHEVLHGIERIASSLHNRLEFVSAGDERFTHVRLKPDEPLEVVLTDLPLPHFLQQVDLQTSQFGRVSFDDLVHRFLQCYVFDSNGLIATAIHNQLD